MWLVWDMWWMCLSFFFFQMSGRRSALQWRKLARQNCLRGRAARYVAAAALCLVAACGCCLATLLPLTTLLGVLAAVLLPSFLRCGVLLSSSQDVLQDGRKKSLFTLQSDDDMILLDRSARDVITLLFVWVVSLSHTIVIELSSSRFCFHNS